MVSERDIEKLKAIGFHIRSDPEHEGSAVCFPNGVAISDDPDITEGAGWRTAKTFVQCEGLKATMAAKIEWLRAQDLNIFFSSKGSQAWSDDQERIYSVSDLDEGGADALFWKVP